MVREQVAPIIIIRAFIKVKWPGMIIGHLSESVTLCLWRRAHRVNLFLEKLMKRVQAATHLCTSTTVAKTMSATQWTTGSTTKACRWVSVPSNCDSSPKTCMSKIGAISFTKFLNSRESLQTSLEGTQLFRICHKLQNN